MRSILAAVLALLALAIPARAEWSIEAMNKQIEETNVIVSGVCSGTVIDVNLRLVLTAYHCVTNNLREVEKKEIDPKTGEIKITKVQERIPMYIETWKRDASLDVISSARFSAVIKGADSASDTALLQVEDQAWTPASAAPFASDGFKYLRGLVVYAVGNPAIIFDNSITVGIISAPARKIDFGDGRKIPLFQHSANTIGGNSGGAIYNADGEIIGTLTGGMRGADISLAVPIAYSKAMITKAGFGAIFK